MQRVVGTVRTLFWTRSKPSCQIDERPTSLTLEHVPISMFVQLFVVVHTTAVFFEKSFEFFMHVLDDVPVKKMKREQGGVEQKRVNLIEKKKVGSNWCTCLMEIAFTYITKSWTKGEHNSANCSKSRFVWSNRSIEVRNQRL